MQRDTAQRRAIRTAIERAGRPLTPNEILAAAREDAPGTGIATVYRALRGLCEEGWLTTVELPGEPARYETAGKGHHHHFQCRACGQVFELRGCPGNLNRLAPRGFRVDQHEVVLYGQCRTCNTTSGSGAGFKE